MLGEDKKTSRGFELVEFIDRSGNQCSIQQSSAIGDEEDALDRPGSSLLWIGVDDGKPQILMSDAERLGLPFPPGEVSGWMPYPIPEEVMLTTRMHLTRKQVKGLVKRLQCWLKTGHLKDNV